MDDMDVKKEKSHRIRNLLIVAVILLVLVGIIRLAGGSVKTPRSAAEYADSSYRTVVDELTEAGFTNINTEAVDDLSSDNISDKDKVAFVSINDDDSFEKGKSFKKDVAIVVGYHAAQHIAVPISSDEIQESEHLAIAEKFSEAGFTNVETEVIVDCDPDTLNGDFFNEVSIDYNSDFAKGDTYAFDSPVKIVCHLPYAKYDVIVHIDFISNLIFSQYDVDYSIDSVDSGTLLHGEDKDLSLRLKEGIHTLIFSEKGSSVNSTELNLEVSDDMEISYQLSCESEHINIKTIYVENKHAAGEGQAMAPDSASNLRYVNYKDTITKLEKAGFTNITTDILYDIVLGITTEGSVASVSIDGVTDFNRGDVFDADAPVLITYHMKEDDDPTKQESETSSADSAATSESNATSYSTNDYETAKKGNSGIFAYVNNGAAYDIYWIIDFDDGYVYYFTDGSGEDFCDRLEIESGDLNTVLTIIYHDGNDIWSYGLHFHYVNNPSKLIVRDEDGFDWEYRTTDLNHALAIRNTKTIHDY